MIRLSNVISLAGGTVVGCLGALLVIGITGERTTGHAQAAGTQKPNILFIMGDDIG